MPLFLLLTGILGVTLIALIINACLKYRKQEVIEVTEQAFQLVDNLPENVVLFPFDKQKNLPPELWKRWEDVANMAHSKTRADLLMILMNDTLAFIKQRDKSDSKKN